MVHTTNHQGQCFVDVFWSCQRHSFKDKGKGCGWPVMPVFTASFMRVFSPNPPDAFEIEGYMGPLFCVLDTTAR